jgi:DNA-binding CsgD family transcriptional regulator
LQALTRSASPESAKSGWLAEAKSNPEIGIILGKSRHTVRKHVEHILTKLMVESRAAAVLRVHQLLGGI